jgi:hypothetical protein
MDPSGDFDSSPETHRGNPGQREISQFIDQNFLPNG